MAILMTTLLWAEKSCECCDGGFEKGIKKQCCSSKFSSSGIKTKSSCCTNENHNNEHKSEKKCKCGTLCSTKDYNTSTKIENSEISFDYLKEFLTLVYSFKIVLITNNIEYAINLKNKQNPLKLPLNIPLRV